MANSTIQPIISTSINQVLELTTSQNLIIHRQVINKICIVGFLICKEDSGNYFKLTINDYTGIIQAFLWKNTTDLENQTVDLPNLEELNYLKILGLPRKTEKDGIYISVLHVQPISNLNEITIHLLEIMKQCYDLKKLKTNYRPITTNDINGNEIKTTNLPNIYGFNRYESMIFNIIKEDTNEKGINFDAVFQKIKSIGRNNAKDAFNSLIKGEHIIAKDGFYKASLNN